MNEGKQRHGCLTAWLVMLIIANSLIALVYLAGGAALGKRLPTVPAWIFPVLAIFCIGNIVFASALFQWKKWGFFGFAATTILAFVVNLLLGLNIGQAILGLLGIIILYGILQIGDQNKGWTQLE